FICLLQTTDAIDQDTFATYYFTSQKQGTSHQSTVASRVEQNSDSPSVHVRCKERSIFDAAIDHSGTERSHFLEFTFPTDHCRIARGRFTIVEFDRGTR